MFHRFAIGMQHQQHKFSLLSVNEAALIKLCENQIEHNLIADFVFGSSFLGRDETASFSAK